MKVPYHIDISTGTDTFNSTIENNLVALKTAIQ